jgi:hypothetical protein
MQFKVGDKVVCVDDVVGAQRQVPANHVYIVTCVENNASGTDSEWVGVDGDSHPDWEALRFKLAEEEQRLLPLLYETCKGDS